MLGTTAVVLVFALWLTRPWLRAMRRLAKRRVEASEWGTPLSEPPVGAEEEAVTLRGRLEADGPIAHLRGPEAVAATLHGSPTGAGHLAAEGLRLRMGEVVIPIEGRVEVLVGALEKHSRSLPEKTEYRFAESKVSPEQRKDRRKRAQLRRIPSGAEVIVRGHLERRAADGSQYREGAHGWALVTGKHGEPVVLAADAPKPVRFPGRDWALRALGLGFLVFALVPLGLEHGGELLQEHGNEQLRDCHPGGHRWLEAADWVARIEGAFPAFGQAALDRRHDALSSAVNGIRVCDIDEDAPAGWIDPLIPLARERLPALQTHRWYGSLRNRLEETLHEAGRDRAIVALQDDLPKGGEITERVRAHLYLGDLQGALATWEEPGAEMSELAPSVLQRGTVLCVAGRYDEALAAFEEHLEAMRDHESDMWRRSTLFRDGLCALRAGDVARAERRAVELSALDLADSETELLRARVAAEQGELGEWAPGEVREAAALQAAVALAEAEEWDRLLEWIERSPLGHRLGGGRIDGASAGIYNEIFYPTLNTAQLETLAERLEAAAPRLAAGEAGPSSEVGPDRPTAIAGPMGRAIQRRASSEAALRRAGQLHRYLAVLYGRRWDPRADAELDDAERLLGAEAVTPLREALAFFHGHWERSRDAKNPEIRNLSLIYLGAEPEPDFSLDGDVRDLGLELLHPSSFEAEHGIAALYRDQWLSNEMRWQRIRMQKLQGSVSSILYRMTHVIVHGANLGFDVSAHRAQLDALGELMESQPDPHLLVGPSGMAEL